MDKSALAVECGGVGGVLFGGGAGDFSGAEEAADGFVEGDHAVFAAVDDVVVDAFDFAATDGGGDWIVVPEDLEGQMSLLAFGDVGQEALADDGPQAEGQERAD